MTQKSLDVTSPIDYEIDNRDSGETWLHITPTEHLRVNPGDLFLNMLENLPEPISEHFQKRFQELLKDIDQSIEAFMDTEYGPTKGD